MAKMPDNMIALILDALAHDAHETALYHGWWEDDRDKGETLFKIVMELCELGKALEDGNPPDKHLPDFTSEEIEAADIVIRIFDYAGRYKLHLGAAILAKMEFNKDRPYRHGKEW